jgi:hypothetical protein
MKKQLLAACSLLALLGVVAFVIVSKGQQTMPGTHSRETQPTNYRISGPYSHKNLTVFLVHGKDLLKGHSFLTLQEALAQKKVIVYETKDVNELAIKNLSNRGCLRSVRRHCPRRLTRTRMIFDDFIVPPNSGRMPIAAFCVESVRWNRRGSEA